VLNFLIEAGTHILLSLRSATDCLKMVLCDRSWGDFCVSLLEVGSSATPHYSLFFLFLVFSQVRPLEVAMKYQHFHSAPLEEGIGANSQIPCCVNPVPSCVPLAMCGFSSSLSLLLFWCLTSCFASYLRALFLLHFR